jgi:threonine aldolase
MLGGAMRQAGVLAAAGLYAIEHHRPRLADDHANARLLAERLGAEAPESNIVMVDLRGAIDADAAVKRARDLGVLVNAVGPRRLRLVTHLDVDRAACERAAELLHGAVN